MHNCEPENYTTEIINSINKEKLTTYNNPNKQSTCIIPSNYVNISKKEHIP